MAQALLTIEFNIPFCTWSPMFFQVLFTTQKVIGYLVVVIRGHGNNITSKRSAKKFQENLINFNAHKSCYTRCKFLDRLTQKQSKTPLRVFVMSIEFEHFEGRNHKKDPAESGFWQDLKFCKKSAVWGTVTRQDAKLISIRLYINKL